MKKIWKVTLIVSLILFDRAVPSWVATLKLAVLAAARHRFSELDIMARIDELIGYFGSGDIVN